MQITTKYDVGDATEAGLVHSIDIEADRHGVTLKYWLVGGGRFYTEDELHDVCDHGLVDCELVAAQRDGRRTTWLHCPECGESVAVILNRRRIEAEWTNPVAS